MNAIDTIARIGTLNTVEEVEALLQGETRKGVTEAGVARIEELKSPPPQERPAESGATGGEGDEATAEAAAEVERKRLADEAAETERLATADAAAEAERKRLADEAAETERLATADAAAEAERKRLDEQGAVRPAAPTKAAAPVQHGRGGQKPAQPVERRRVYKLPNPEQFGTIYFKGTSYDRATLAKDQAVLEALYKAGNKQVILL